MKPKKRTELELSACHEVQIQYCRPLYATQKKISSSEDAEILLREFIDLDRIDHKEFFWVMLLSGASRLIAISEIGAGNTAGVVVNFKEIFQLCLLTNASNLIVAHCHPSGRLGASASDLEVTKKIKKATKLFEITLLDHLIITSEGFYSFSDNGLL